MKIPEWSECPRGTAPGLWTLLGCQEPAWVNVESVPTWSICAYPPVARTWTSRSGLEISPLRTWLPRGGLCACLAFHACQTTGGLGMTDSIKRCGLGDMSLGFVEAVPPACICAQAVSEHHYYNVHISRNQGSTVGKWKQIAKAESIAGSLAILLRNRKGWSWDTGDE